MPKNKAKKGAFAAQDASSLLDLAVGTLGPGLEALNKCVAAAAADLDDLEAYDSTKGSHLAWLVNQQSTTLNALRQLEKHDRDTLERMTPEKRLANVLTYLEHELPAAKRGVVRELLDRLDEEQGLLS